MRAAAALTLGAALLVACGEPSQAPADPGASVLLPAPSDPTISFSLSFGVGSQDDPPGKQGLAYLTGEMLASASTENNSYEAILEKLYPIASSYQVRVDKETSTLTGRTHRDNTGVFLELLTDAFLRPAFAEDDFARIRNDTINYIENTLRYASDEELAKAALTQRVYAGTPYAHPVAGTVESLRSITLEDVAQFYARHYTAGNVVLGLAGGFDDPLRSAFELSLEGLPQGETVPDPALRPATVEATEALLIAKPGADASISLGFPIDVHRGERDFYALWIANSWLGEHRNLAGRLFQVIRDQRGLNYGDYSYIEAFPEGGQRTMPPVNVARRSQMFEIWIRTLPNEQALFALRAALLELERLVDGGMSREEFELRRSFLDKYALHFAETTSERLGYALDDRFYGIDAPGHLEQFRAMLAGITLEEVNAALKLHLRADKLKIAIVTGEAENLSEALIGDTPTPVTYESPKSQPILDADELIERHPLSIDAENITIVAVEDIFQR